MLRTAVNAGTPVGLRAKDIMARGELVPDDVVVAIVSDRIDQPDARNGFILDGFPRTVPQAHALDRMLAQKGLKLDAVIELRVDEGILLKRIEKRIDEMKARGEPLRDDDNPEVLRRRLLAYRDQTAPLVTYYKLQSVLRTVDGMAAIADVANAIDQTLRAPAAKAPTREAAPKKAAEPAPKSKAKASKARANGPKTAPAKAGRGAAKPANNAAKKAVAKPRAGGAKTANKHREIARPQRFPRQACPAQKQSPAEVDETPLNPLITPASMSRVRTMPSPGERGGVSRYRLQTPSMANYPPAGRVGRQPGVNRGAHRRCQYTDQQTGSYCIAIYPWNRAEKGQ